MQHILLWEKYDKFDRYGVINDDRMWYAIAMARIYAVFNTPQG